MNIKLLNYLQSKPVVNIATIKKFLGCNTKYASLVISRLKEKGILKKITRNKYTALENVYVVSTNIYTPSYLSLWSASQYLGYTEQILNTIHIVTTARKRELNFEGYKIKFIVFSQKYFFGYKKEPTEKGAIFIVEKEKLIIDSLLRWKEMGNFDEILKVIKNIEIDEKKLIGYLKKTNNISLIKRVGFLLEENKGIDISPKFKIKDSNYIPLNPWGKRTKKINSKWRLRL